MTGFQGEVMLLGWADTSSRGKTVTFALHPDECPGEHPFRDFGTGKTGQRFALVAVPITDDDEQPHPAALRNPLAETPGPPQTSPRASEAGAAKSKRPFSSLPLSQQCAIKCDDVQFQLWMGRTHGAETIHELREFLGIQSRAELDTDEKAAARWRALVTEFEQATGRLPEKRG